MLLIHTESVLVACEPSARENQFWSNFYPTLDTHADINFYYHEKLTTYIFHHQNHKQKKLYYCFLMYQILRNIRKCFAFFLILCIRYKFCQLFALKSLKRWTRKQSNIVKYQKHNITCREWKNDEKEGKFELQLWFRLFIYTTQIVIL